MFYSSLSSTVIACGVAFLLTGATRAQDSLVSAAAAPSATTGALPNGAISLIPLRASQLDAL